MADLKTTYMGIELKNPIIVGASNLVIDINNLKKLEEAGAAAIVYKSLFEEQIQLEGWELEQNLNEYNERNAEMSKLFPDIEHAGPEEFLIELKKAVEAVNIPVFGSLNCTTDQNWVDWAVKLEETGIAGLELNFYAVPESFDTDGADLVGKRIEIIKKIKDKLSIPVAAKLSPYYSNLLNVAKRMDESNLDALVLFNRLFQPEIDIHREKNYFPYNLSNPEDYKLPLRFAGLLHKNINAEVCANTGIYTGEDVVRMLLAGAQVVQIVSTIYRNGPEYIENMLADIANWMGGKQYATLDDFRGKLARVNQSDPLAYRRAQYVDILLKSNQIFKKYPMV